MADEELAVRWLQGYPVGQFEVLVHVYERLRAAAVDGKQAPEVDRELNTLWVCLSGDDPDRAGAALVLLERLFLDKVVPLPRILDGVLVHSGSRVGNPYGSVALLLRIMRHFGVGTGVERQGSEDAMYEFASSAGHPVGTRFGLGVEPVHPAVVVMRTTPRLASLILIGCDEIVRSSGSCAGFDVVAPVFQQALLNPDAADNTVALARTEGREKLSRLVLDLDILPAFHVLLQELQTLNGTDAYSVQTRAVCVLENLVRLVATCRFLGADKELNMVDALVYPLCGVVWDCARANSGPLGLLALTHLRSVLPLMSLDVSPFLWVFLGAYLSTCPVNLFDEALSSALHILERDGFWNISDVVLLSFFPAVCSIFGNGDRKQQGRAVGMAAKIFARLVSLKAPVPEKKVGESRRSSLLPKFRVTNGWLYADQPIVGQVLGALAVLDGSRDLDEDLARVVALCESGKVLDCVVDQNVALGAFCVASGSSDCKSQFALLDPVVRRGERDAPTALRLLPVLLATLNFQSDLMKKEVLSVIPRMAVHKACIKNILNVVAALRSKDALKVTVLHTMLAVWRVEERCFGELELMLMDQSPQLEWTVAKALAIRELCHLRGQKVGMSFLKDIINSLQSKSVPEIVRVCALDSITPLCRAGVVELQSLWEPLKSLLRNDRHQQERILEKAFDLLALEAEVERTTRVAQAFHKTVLAFLWERALQQDPDPTVSGLAFRALAKFEVDDFRPSMLPARFQPISLAHSLGQLGMREDVDFLPGECYVRMLEELPDTGDEMTVDYRHFGQFLSSVVAHEMRQMGKRAYTMGMSKAEQRKSERNVAGEPPKYDYLDEKASVLRHLVAWLAGCGKDPAALSTPRVAGKVAVCLDALDQPFFSATHGLPPLFWPGVLQPLLAQDHLAYRVLDLCISLSRYSPSAKDLLSRILTSDPALGSTVVMPVALFTTRLADLAVVLDVQTFAISVEGHVVNNLEFAPPDEASLSWLDAVRTVLTDARVPVDNRRIVVDSLLKLGEVFNMNCNSTLTGAYRRCLVELPPDTFLSLCNASASNHANDDSVWETAAALRVAMVERCVAAGVPGKSFDSNPLKWLFAVVDWCPAANPDRARRLGDLLLRGLRAVPEPQFRVQWLSHHLDVILQTSLPDELDDPTHFVKGLTTRLDIVAKSVIVFSGIEGLLEAVSRHPSASSTVEARFDIFCLAIVPLVRDPVWAPCLQKLLDVVLVSHCPSRFAGVLEPVYRRGLARASLALRALPEMSDPLYWTRVADLGCL